MALYISSYLTPHPFFPGAFIIDMYPVSLCHLINIEYKLKFIIMSLTEKIASDLIAAMKAKDKVVLEAIRAAKTAFTLARTEKSGDTVLTSEEELKIIQKLVKQRRESAAIYKEQNRPDLYEKEVIEADVLEKYLPAKISDAELLNIIKGIIERVGAKSPADMGKVMGVATKELAGKADGKEISAKVKQLLGS